MPASRLQGEHLTAGYEGRRILDAEVLRAPNTGRLVCVPTRESAYMPAPMELSA